MRADYLTIQEAVIGDPLKHLGRRPRLVQGPGNLSARRVRALTGNVRGLPQSVIKRISKGGCHTKADLKRQFDYITREDGAMSIWGNFSGIDRELSQNVLARTATEWASAWRGAPKRGHTDHIVLSFPKGTNVETAEAVAREWGRDIFASGDYGDQWRYVAAIHDDKEHIHAHFVVDKVGCDWGRFLSISQKSEINYDIMRERHAQIATEHGIEMVASSRLSRGIIENAPRNIEARIAHEKGLEPAVVPLTAEERVQRQAVVASFAEQYRALAELAQATPGGEAARGPLLTASQCLERGQDLMEQNTTDVGADPFEQLAAAHERLINEAQGAWDSIQSMAPSAERAAMEARFADATSAHTELFKNDPFLAQHLTVAHQTVDPLYIKPMETIVRVAYELPDGDGRHESLEIVTGEIKDQLKTELGSETDALSALNITAGEIAEYFMQGFHTEGQVASFNERLDGLPNGEIAQEALEHLNDKAHEIVGSVRLPRAIQELVAIEEIAQAPSDTRFADLSRTAELVREIREDLSDGELVAISTGDHSALEAYVKDPILRDAVVQELTAEDSNAREISRDIHEVQEQILHRREQEKVIKADHIIHTDHDHSI